MFLSSVSCYLRSLPFTNSQVERMFSTLKVIKTDRRTSLQRDTLSDLMEINTEGPPLSSFSADHAVDLWWTQCARRPNQSARKPYRSRQEESDKENDTDSQCTITLDDWFSD